MKKNTNIVLPLIMFGILSVITVVIQTTLAYRITFFGATADIILGTVASVGILRKENTAALFGLISGLMVDALGSVGISIMPIFYMFIGYFCGRMGDRIKKGASFRGYAIFLPLLCLFRIAITLISFTLKYFGQVNYIDLFVNTLVPEYIYTLFVCFVMFFVVKLFEMPIRIFEKREGLN